MNELEEERNRLVSWMKMRSGMIKLDSKFEDKEFTKKLQQQLEDINNKIKQQ